MPTTVLSERTIHELDLLDAFMAETARSHFAVGADCRTLADDLRDALAPRSVVDRATGMLMSGLDYGAYEAFDLLCRASKEADRSVDAVAQGMVDAQARTQAATTDAP